MTTGADPRLHAFAVALEGMSSTMSSLLDELSLVRCVGEAISSTNCRQELCAKVVNAIAATIRCQYVSIFAGKSGDFRREALAGAGTVPDGFPETLAGSSLALAVAEAREPLYIDHSPADDAQLSTCPFPSSLVSVLTVPLVEGSELRGVLCLADDEAGAFGEKTLRTMEMIVPQIAGTLARIELYDDSRATLLKYGTLVDRMPEAVFICNDDWIVNEANGMGKTLFGEPEAGGPFTRFFCSAATADEFKQAVRKKGNVQDFEADLLTAGLDRLIALISCSSFQGRYFVIVRDITERHDLVAKVVQAQKMEAIGGLADSVAHEFNNIFGVVLPNAQLLKLRSQGDVTLSRFADVIINSSRQAKHLSKRLLGLGKEILQITTAGLQTAGSEK